jgi:hypothetical protein
VKVGASLTAVAAIAAIVLAPGEARAHPLALGVLVVREHADGQVETSFRFSGTEARATGAEPVLAARCRAVGVATERALDDGGTSRDARFDCGPGGLAGGAVAVRGMEGTGVQILVQIERADGSTQGALLDDTTREIVLAEDRVGSVISDHVALGVEHIALGVDHLLFVLALILVVRGTRALLLTITAFTVGHSLTLALAARATTIWIARPSCAAVPAIAPTRTRRATSTLRSTAPARWRWRRGASTATCVRSSSRRRATGAASSR